MPLKACEDVRPGDIVFFMGEPHLVDRIEEYKGPFDFILGTARDVRGWGISLERGQMIEVA